MQYHSKTNAFEAVAAIKLNDVKLFDVVQVRDVFHPVVLHSINIPAIHFLQH